MKTRIKISHLTQKLKALLRYFGGQSFASNIFGSESISLHDIALFLFDYEIWLNEWKKIIKHGSSSLPVIDRSSEFLFAGPSIPRVFRSPKSILKPYYEFFIAARYFKHAMPLKAVSIFALFNIANIKTAFTVNKSCKISDLPNLMIDIELYDFRHECPFKYNSIVVNEKEVHAERLNERGSVFSRACESLNSIRKIEREIRRGFPA